MTQRPVLGHPGVLGTALLQEKGEGQRSEMSMGVFPGRGDFQLYWAQSSRKLEKGLAKVGALGTETRHPCPSLHCPLCPPTGWDQSKPGPVAQNWPGLGMSWDQARVGGIRVGGSTSGLSSYRREAQALPHRYRPLAQVPWGQTDLELQRRSLCKTQPGQAPGSIQLDSPRRTGWG